MAFTTLTPLISGSVPTAAYLNAYRDNLLSLRNGNDYYVKVYLTSNQLIPNTTGTKVSWGSVEFQSGTIWVPTAPTRFTAPVAGKWLVICNTEWRKDTNNFRNIVMVKNGNIWALKSQGSVGGKSNSSGARCFSMAAGEFFEIQVFHNAGTAINLHGGSADRTRCSLLYMGV